MSRVQGARPCAPTLCRPPQSHIRGKRRGPPPVAGVRQAASQHVGEEIKVSPRYFSLYFRQKACGSLYVRLRRRRKRGSKQVAPGPASHRGSAHPTLGAWAPTRSPEPTNTPWWHQFPLTAASLKASVLRSPHGKPWPRSPPPSSYISSMNVARDVHGAVT